MDDPTTPSVGNQSAFRRPPSSSSSQLNLPPTMSRPSLYVEPSTPSRHIDRMVGLGYHPSPSRTIYSDRFIPSRSGSNFALFDIPPPSNSSSDSREDSSGAYATLLRNALFGPDSGIVSPVTPDKAAGLNGRNSPISPPSRNIFRYKTETRQSMHSLSPFGFDDQLPGVSHSPVKAPRKVPRSPYKVLDAPALQDDFYLNLVDWSSHNVLAVGLGNCVYLWNACSSKVTKLCDLGIDDSVCSVGWAQRGTHLAVGTSNGKLQIWDASRCRREDFVSKLTGHKSEVCGLKWSYDNRELASGGNDNRLFVWNQHSTQPVLKYCEHTAAVKAIAWSPHLHGLLASGGGTADRCIRFWNTTTNSHLSCMDTWQSVDGMNQGKGERFQSYNLKTPVLQK
ncbi:hypothetical protein F0562_012727 [Nyssa sinensis]|uniref:Uncharacterized protein n=1 Tax=Nyssa sinensis TaxID=561372 RepID=A0A5J4ZV99_9ASTE|nr:hypothetical protein F0562_012727 [Nyssa sinensis]